MQDDRKRRPDAGTAEATIKAGKILGLGAATNIRNEGSFQPSVALLTVRQVASALAISVRQVWKLASSGLLPQPLALLVRRLPRVP